jgi:uncharacterized delta-60 repeat protein
MKHVRLAALAFAALTALTAAPSAATAVPGDLESTFGTNGVVVTEVGPGDARANALVQQSTGKLVAAGGGPTGDVLLVRYATAGTVDPTFGTDGVVTTDLGGSDSATAAVVQPDDKVVAAVATSGSDRGPALLVRYLPDGALDTAFGVGGVASVPIDTYGALSAALQPDGKIVVAGGPGTSGVDLIRFTTDGALDASFGNGGKVATSFASPGSSSPFYGLAVQPDGRIVVKANTATSVALARYLPNGTPDPTFGTGGRVQLVHPLRARSLALQPDGNLVLAGTDTEWNVVVVRLTTSGALDSGFDGDGIVTTDLALSSAATALALEPSGKLVVAGYISSGFRDTDFLVIRYQPNGAVDTGFGTNGAVVTSIGGFDVPSALIVQPDGRIVAAGSSQIGFWESLTVVRYHGGSATTPFATLRATAWLTNLPGPNDAVSVNATFDLGPSSNGIDPTTEAVELHVGSLSVVLPPGSVTRRVLWWSYRGGAAGGTWTVTIRRWFGSYRLTATGTSLDLREHSSTVDVGVTIGDDAGTTTAGPLGW